MELVELLNRLNESISSFILDGIPAVVGFDYREQWQASDFISYCESDEFMPKIVL